LKLKLEACLKEASKISCHSWTKFASLFGRHIPKLQPVLPASDTVQREYAEKIGMNLMKGIQVN